MKKFIVGFLLVGGLLGFYQGFETKDVNVQADNGFGVVQEHKEAAMRMFRN